MAVVVFERMPGMVLAWVLKRYAVSEALTITPKWLK
jgi:hypothetical protein